MSASSQEVIRQQNCGKIHFCGLATPVGCELRKVFNVKKNEHAECGTASAAPSVAIKALHAALLKTKKATNGSAHSAGRWHRPPFARNNEWATFTLTGHWLCGRLKICECSRWRARWAPQPHHGHCHRYSCCCCRSTWIFSHFTFCFSGAFFIPRRQQKRSGKVTSGVIALWAVTRVRSSVCKFQSPSTWIWAQAGERREFNVHWAPLFLFLMRVRRDD